VPKITAGGEEWAGFFDAAAAMLNSELFPDFDPGLRIWVIQAL
jgi:hypothetical protein